ncbi:MAG: alkylation response protein AidB-like acyl-CoA dehydrogenase, partial [Halioglobus sp.]
MDFSFNEDQNAIRALASQIFTDRTSDEFMMDFSRAGHTYDDTLWSTLAQQGLLGITVPEEFGGTGLGFTELCLILEEQGRRISPVPLYASLVLGVLPIVKFGTDEQKAKYLAPLAAGELKLTAAIAELGICAAAAGQVSASQQGDTWTL